MNPDYDEKFVINLDPERMGKEFIATVELIVRKYDTMYGKVINMHNAIKWSQFFDEVIFPILEEHNVAIVSITMVANGEKNV